MEYSQYIAHIITAISRVWNYPLFDMDGQNVTLSSILLAVILLFVGLRFAKTLSKITTQNLFRILTLDPITDKIIANIIHYFFVMIVVVMVLDIVHVPLTAFTFIGGALAVSIGIGGQHLMSNLIAGVALMIEKPLKVGDLIEFDTLMGRVINTGFRSVTIKSLSNKFIYIPNNQILQNKFINWTANDNQVRLHLSVELAETELPLKEVIEILSNAISASNAVLVNPAPQVLFINFKEGNLYFEVNFWINLIHTDRQKITSEIYSQIYNSLKNNNIAISKAH